DVADALVTGLVVAVDHHEDVPAGGDAAQQGDGRLRRGGPAAGECVDDVDAAAAGAVGERPAQCRRDHLLRGPLRVVARVRAVDDAAAGVLGGADRALTGAAGPLLLERLATGS